MSVLTSLKARLAIRRKLQQSAQAKLDHRNQQVAEIQREIAQHTHATRVSHAGVELIKQFEGFPNHGNPYQDPVGVWTIGYGHIEGVGPHTPQITEPQAAALLQRDLDSKYAPSVSRLGLPLNQNQFDALVSFVYNVGPGAISAKTRVGKALRRHDWHAAADHLLEWDKAGGHPLPGLTRRRHAERDLFLKATA
jgi:lysozyme